MASENVLPPRIGTLRTNFTEILIQMQSFSFMKMH